MSEYQLKGGWVTLWLYSIILHIKKWRTAEIDVFIKISYSLSSFTVWKGKKIQKQKKNDRKRNKPTDQQKRTKQKQLLVHALSDVWLYAWSTYNRLETECMIYSFIKLTDWLNKELLIIHSYLEKDCWEKSVRQPRR